MKFNTHFHSITTLFVVCAALYSYIWHVNGFVVPSCDRIHRTELSFSAKKQSMRSLETNKITGLLDSNCKIQNLSVTAIVGLLIFLGGPQITLASEIGVEVEAPTFITGETVEICTKRGILGACLKTELRTEQNDNDVAKKYFRDPSEIIREREAALRSESEEGSALIQKLRQQSIDNAEKNNLIVQRKTFENDQSATFGPFDRQVLIMNTDGKTFTLLQNPQAMRLKKAGFIDGRRQFIKQPSQEDLDKALESEGFFAGIFGGN